MNREDLVSIITPSYNTGEYIEETIDSVLNQTYDNWEMIIVDDCSTDNTDDIVAQYDDDRIIYVKNEKNSGAAVSRNRALRMAKGKWIAFLDSDDVWLPEKLEKQINFMEENDYHFTGTYYSEINEKSESIGKVNTGPSYVPKYGMYAYCWPGCLTVIYDHELVGLIQIADIKKRNDYAIWLDVTTKSNFYMLDEVLAKYRRREGSISNTSLKKLLKSQYDMYRISDGKSVVKSSLFTLTNCVFGVIKKKIYCKKDEKNV